MSAKSCSSVALLLAFGCGGAGSVDPGDASSSGATSGEVETDSTSGDPTATDGSTSAPSTTSPTTEDDSGSESSGGELPDDPFGSGSRLTARYYDGGDGSIALQDWYDEELELACAFRRTDDGDYLCLPVKSAGWRFADAQCSIPVAMGDDIEVGDLVRRDFRRECSDPLGAYRVGEAQQFATLYRVEGDGCEVSLTDATAFTLTPVADDMFVAATEVDAPQGDLEAQRILAEDGAFQSVGVRRAGGSPCGAFLTHDGERCIDLPRANVPAMFFEDDTCTTVVAVNPFDGSALCLESDPRYAAALDRGSTCELRWNVHELGEAVSDSDVYVEEGTCVPLLDADTPFEGSLFWQLGDVVSPDTFPLVGRVALGDGAARPLYLADGDVPLHHDPVLQEWIGPDGEPCGIVPTDTGLRCYPHAGIIPLIDFGTFSDPACTTPVYVADTDCGPKPWLVEFDGTRLARMIEAEIWDGPLYVQSTDASCLAMDPDPSSTYVVAGEEVPLSSLPGIDERFDR